MGRAAGTAIVVLILAACEAVPATTGTAVPTAKSIAATAGSEDPVAGQCKSAASELLSIRHALHQAWSNLPTGTTLSNDRLAAAYRSLGGTVDVLQARLRALGNPAPVRSALSLIVEELARARDAAESFATACSPAGRRVDYDTGLADLAETRKLDAAAGEALTLACD